MRALDTRGIQYRALEYDASGAFHTGEEAATLVGAPAECVYKTLVVLREGEARAQPLVVMVAVEQELDLKLLAGELGAKKLRMASQKEAEKLTGMQVGGISALGLQKADRFEVLIDRAVDNLDRVHVSAGTRGIDLELRVSDLLDLTRAKLVRCTS